MIPAEPELVDLLRAGRAVKHFFVFVDHPDEPVYAWSGVGDVEWQGQTWKGVGEFGAIGGIEDTEEIREGFVTLQLRSIPNDYFVDDLSGRIAGRRVVIYRRFSDESFRFFDTFRTWHEGQASHFDSVDDPGGLITITLTSRTKLSQWRESPEAYYSNEEWLRIYGDDTGFSEMVALQGKTTEGWLNENATNT